MIEIGSRIRIPLSLISAEDAKALRKELTLKNPDYIARVRLGRGVWDIPKKVEWFRRCLGPHGFALEVPRGLVTREVLERIPKDQVVDRRVDGRVGPWPASKVEPRPFQARAAQALLEREQGLVVAPCGAGKSILACEAIRSAERDALIVVHTADLMRQWASNLEEHLGERPRIIGAGAGKRASAPGPRLTVATVQALLHRPDLDELLRTGILIVDEAHHCPAETFDRIVQASPSRYRWGLTATPKRADGLDDVLGFVFGDVVARAETAELVEAGTLIRPRYIQIHTEFDWPDWEPGSSLAPLLDALAVDERRNRLVLDLLESTDRPTLALVGSVEHAVALAAALEGAESLTSRNKKAGERTAILDRVRSGQTRILVATTVADEGLDLPCLERLVLVAPSRAASRLQQRIGRVARPAPGKTSAVVFDLVDLAPPLQAQAVARRRVARKLCLMA